jgi:prepilin-type N-terminal cleavage/methylation domain-containing protein
MKMNKQKGFSLVELLVTLAIFSIVIVIAVNLFINSMASSREYEENKENQEIINVISDVLYRDILEADLDKTQEVCDTGYIVSLYVGDGCNYYYTEDVAGNILLKYIKEGKTFTLAEKLPNENAIRVTELSKGFFTIEVLIHENKNDIVFHAYNKNEFHKQ